MLIWLDEVEDKIKCWARYDVPENMACRCFGVDSASMASAFVLLACCFCFWVRASLVVSACVKFFPFFPFLFGCGD